MNSPGFKQLYFLLVVVALQLTLTGPALAQNVSTLTATPFVASGDVAVADNGDIFVANFGVLLNNANGGEVYRVTPAGMVSEFANGFAGASGNTFDDLGNLYQSNIAGNSIFQVTPAGVVSVFATTAQGLSSPVGLTFDSLGNLYAANCGSGSIQQITPQGVGTAFTTSNLLSCPNGLTIDNDDNLYAANFNNGQIIKITPQGNASLLATTPAGSSKPAGSNGHIIFANDLLYVVSNASHQVFELTLDGQLTVLAGSGQRGRADGSLLQASFSLPNGIDISPDGKLLYVNDSEGLSNNNDISPNVVRVIELPNGLPDFFINPGLNGSWFNPDTSGQGFFIDVFPGIPLVFLAWFTYDTTQPAMGSPPAVVGDINHRWITAQGAFDGTSATLDVTLTTGGLFDDPTNTSNSDPGSYGTIELEFSDCSTGTVTYDFFAIGLSGTVPIQRIASDNVPLCETLVENGGMLP